MVAAGLQSLRNTATRRGAPGVRERVAFAARQEGDGTVPDLHMGGESQTMRFGIVDDVKALVGGTATLFVKDGDTFVRVSTNVEKDDGSRAGETLREIVDGAREADGMIGQIATAAEQQSATSEQMARSVDAISTVASESAQDLTEIADATGNLDRLTTELRAMLDTIRPDGAPPAGGPRPAAPGGDGHAAPSSASTLAVAAARGDCPVPH